MESNDLEICCYTRNRRVKRREGKPLRFAKAIRATIFTSLDASASTALAGEKSRKLGNSEGGQRHQQDRPLPGRFYKCIRPRLINTLPPLEATETTRPGTVSGLAEGADKRIPETSSILNMTYASCRHRPTDRRPGLIKSAPAHEQLRSDLPMPGESESRGHPSGWPLFWG